MPEVSANNVTTQVEYVPIPTPTQLDTIESQNERILIRLQEIENTLARFEEAIGGFVGGIQAATAQGGMAGMLARAVVPQGQMSMPKLGG